MEVKVNNNFKKALREN